MAMLLGLVLCACPAAPSNPVEPPLPGAPVPVSPLLHEAHALIGLSRDELLARLGADASALKRGKYGPSDWMESIVAPSPVAGDVFLADGRVVLISLHRGYAGPTIIDAMHVADLEAAHPNAEWLRSRSGKHFNHRVDAPAGLAWSEGEGRVTYMEVFAPTDLDMYKQRFYDDPGTFYK